MGHGRPNTIGTLFVCKTVKQKNQPESVVGFGKGRSKTLGGCSRLKPEDEQKTQTYWTVDRFEACEAKKEILGLANFHQTLLPRNKKDVRNCMRLIRTDRSLNCVLQKRKVCEMCWELILGITQICKSDPRSAVQTLPSWRARWSGLRTTW